MNCFFKYIAIFSFVVIGYVLVTNAKAPGSLNAPSLEKNVSPSKSVTSVADNDNVVDEVVWVVGDEAILKSDVEFMRMSYEYNKVPLNGDPYVLIPEELAIRKLFLHQAQLDSIEVTENMVKANVDAYIDAMIEEAGSEENLVKIRQQPIKQLRADLIQKQMEEYLISEVRKNIVANSKVTPAEVRRYVKAMPVDSLPIVPTQVEVQIVTQTPYVEPEEIDRVKSKLVELAARVNNGESFSMLARLNSIDGSRKDGGELGFMSKGELVKEFADVAFALTDPKTVSRVVKTEYGYHIIQLIERRGDKVNCRHILMKPNTTDAEIMKTINRLDSVANLVKTNVIDFEKAVADNSDDSDSRNNCGLLANKFRSKYEVTSRFQMSELHRVYQDIAKKVETMKVGDVSDAFLTHNSKGLEVGAVIKLKTRIPEHRADITADFQLLSDIVVEKHNEELVNKWIADKIKTTYIKIKDKWKRSGYQYDWLKQNQ